MHSSSRILVSVGSSRLFCVRGISASLQLALPLPNRDHQPYYASGKSKKEHQRWLTSSSTTGSTTSSKTSTSDKSDDTQKPELLYEGPMSSLITSLKVFSLSSAILSSVGLPALVVFKGMDTFGGIHVAMITTTVMGACASTIGLQWIFAPYVYTLERIPIRQCHYVKASPEEDSPREEKESSSSNSPCLLKATTRSIFLTRIHHVFDPEMDVSPAPRSTIRPFCSFFVKGKPLYIHEQLIQSPQLSKALFVNKAEPIKTHKNPDPDDEFL
ncbi:Inherit from NOG: transmembrane protein 70 [Seminavis robusta]|uniref:Inherit from NOG: transmembrane protein 70 n=1 Tax=Seminavis robusta TaxID=568900 RepID=A0A9N8E447_9STRA|nr:Inherit from NOG: transmembrane protein 70 [Seminavis robusta]|eukprot:Sro600_g173400.1 Inherit from NOG: transmembrane protein 70 (271) ;mRNA; f:27761-28777